MSAARAQITPAQAAASQLARIELIRRGLPLRAPCGGDPWSVLCRDDQREPDPPWRYWIVLAGRGYGKTRVGAEWVVKHAASGEFGYVNLIGATADDARDIMIDGESGILAVCDGRARGARKISARPNYVKSARRIDWPNGCRSLIFTADEPERLRGKQHHKLWCDELASWRYAEAWTQATLGLRLPPNPQALITTTPKPRKFLRSLVEHDAAVVTRGTTYDNRANLDPSFFDEIIKQYEGTALGQQELEAKMLEQAEGALWQRWWIEETRVGEWPEELVKVAIGVDPPGGATECGIAAAGVDSDGDIFVGHDRTARLSPDGWARASIDAYDAMSADEIVGEANFGGDMVESTIATAARAVGRIVPTRLVHASRGKAVRAQPIAALWEQGRGHLVGSCPELEDQMTGWVPGVSKDSPNNLDAMVWAAHAVTRRIVSAILRG